MAHLRRAEWNFLWGLWEGIILMKRNSNLVVGKILAVLDLKLTLSSL